MAGAVGRDGARLRAADRDRARLEAQGRRNPARASPACAPSPCSGSAAGSPGCSARSASPLSRQRSSPGMVAVLVIGYARPTSTNRPDATSAVAAMRTVAIGFLAGIGSPALAIACAAIGVALLALQAGAARFRRAARRRRREGARALCGHCRRGPAVPAERPLRPARRVEPAAAVAGGRAGHRLFLPRLCREPDLRRAARNHRDGADRRRLQLDCGDPGAGAAARAAKRRRARSRPGSRLRPRSCTCASRS